MRSTILGAICASLALVATSPSAQAQGSWKCETPATLDPDVQANYAALSSGNRAMERIVQEYRGRWDAKFIRATCERFSLGERVEISCLNGRRDWTEIKAMIPTDYFGMPKDALRPHYLLLQSEGDGLPEAVQYCRDVGAIR